MLELQENIDHVIFDLDGTLIDSASGVIYCINKVLIAENLKSQKPLSNVLIGPPLLEILASASGVTDQKRLERMSKRFKAYYDSQGYQMIKVFPGLDSFMKELRDRNICLHIATNKRFYPTKLILKYLSWNNYFISIYAKDSNGLSYPNKGVMLQSLLDEQSINPDDAIYVGDQPEDRVAADEAGLGFNLAYWGYGEV